MHARRQAVIVTVAFALLSPATRAGDDPILSTCIRYEAGTDSTCVCMASEMTAKLSAPDRAALAHELDKIFRNASDNEAAGRALGERIMAGTLVSPEVGKQVLASAKLCGNLPAKDQTQADPP